MAGTLYVVGTPIGNLEDMTFRAVRVLREADLIACEDTRQTRKLLDHYGIVKPAISYHEHNEAERTPELLERLLAGAAVAIVSDAGTPLVSDPGYRLVTAAIENGITVVPVPGPSALLTALGASGMATDAFFFGGFLPAKTGQRRRVLEGVQAIPATLVFYEAPHRIVETLEDVEQVLGPRRVVMARELTKIHEEFLRGAVGDVREQLAGRASIKGEITLLIERGGHRVDDRPLAAAVEDAERSGLNRMEAIKAVARERKLSKREVYDAVQVKQRRTLD
jgi:16S rRNA (cytidine1402-2'-O)-methyltransferase